MFGLNYIIITNRLQDPFPDTRGARITPLLGSDELSCGKSPHLGWVWSNTRKASFECVCGRENPAIYLGNLT